MIKTNTTPEMILDDITDLQMDIHDMNSIMESQFLQYIEDTLYYCEKYLNELIDIKEENDQE